MAQALINHELGGGMHAISAGTHPGPKVADGAIEALRLGGISTAGLSPKAVEAVMHEPIDLVVTVCDNARETCPVFPRPVTSLHMPFHDPHGEPLESFIRVRDEIRARLLPELQRRFAV
jgi:arsenate reductase